MPFPRAAAALHRALPLHRLRERTEYEEACQDAPGSFLDLPCGRTHYVEAGQGAPVILLHGFLYTTLMWRPVLEPLGEHFRALAFDLLGWGYSARNDRLRYDYQLYADQLLQLLDALEIDRASLIGQSMGAGTIIRFAVQHPDRVERMVLVDAASLPNPLPLAGRTFALPFVGELLLGTGGNAVTAKNVKDLWFYDRSKVTPAYVEELTAPMRIKGSAWTLLNILRELDFGSQEEQVAALGELSLPTLLVWGRQDKAVPLPLGQKMHEMLPGSELLIIEEAGHTPHEEHPEQFLERVIPFLSARS